MTQFGPATLTIGIEIIPEAPHGLIRTNGTNKT